MEKNQEVKDTFLTVILVTPVSKEEKVVRSRLNSDLRYLRRSVYNEFSQL